MKVVGSESQIELVKYKTVNGIDYYQIDNSKYSISKCGKVMGKVNKELNSRMYQGKRIININGRIMSLIDIVLNVFYNKKPKDIGSYVLLFKNSDNKTIINYDTVKPTSISDFCESEKPGIPYACYEYSGNNYILFNTGELFNIKLGKYLTFRTGRVLKYTIAGKVVYLKDILIEHFGSAEMLKQKKRWDFVGDGHSFDDLKLTEFDEDTSIDEIIEESIVDLEVNKYICNECKLTFKASGIKQIIRLNKLCIPCSRYLNSSAYAEQPKPVKLLPLDNRVRTKSVCVCRRCMTEHANHVESCVACDCIDIVNR